MRIIRGLFRKLVVGSALSGHLAGFAKFLDSSINPFFFYPSLRTGNKKDTTLALSPVNAELVLMIEIFSTLVRKEK